MDLVLDGRVAVVTGASRGIGLAVTRALVQEGAFVIGGALDSGQLRDIPGATGVDLDLSQPTAPDLLVQRALNDHGRVDVLVAARSRRRRYWRSAHHLSGDEFDLDADDDIPELPAPGQNTAPTPQ